MASNSKMRSILIVTTSFISGVATGLLLASKNSSPSRRWPTHRFHNNIPDLYEATEDIPLSEHILNDE